MGVRSGAHALFSPGNETGFMRSGKVSFSLSSGKVRECQGSLRWSGENSTFVLCVREKMLFFVITKVCNLFSLQSKVLIFIHLKFFIHGGPINQG